MALAAFVDDWRPHTGHGPGGAVLAALEAVLSLVRAWASGPDDGARLEIHVDGRREPVALPPGVDETMRTIGNGLLDVHDAFAALRDDLCAARANMRWAEQDSARRDVRPHGLADAAHYLDTADDHVWHLLCGLGYAASAITGQRAGEPLPDVVGALAAIVDALGGRVTQHTAQLPERRAHWAGR